MISFADHTAAVDCLSREALHFFGRMTHMRTSYPVKISGRKSKKAGFTLQVAGCPLKVDYRSSQVGLCLLTLTLGFGISTSGIPGTLARFSAL
jgi:hypothetical protein